MISERPGHIRFARGEQYWRKAMKRMSFGKIAIAATGVACATLFSFGWSEQRGVSLSIESAEARVGRPLTPVSVAGVARRQNRRAAYGAYGGYGGYGYGYGAAAVGAGLAAGAVGATAFAAATSPADYYGSEPYAGGGWYATSPWGDYVCRPPHTYGCSPYASKDWYRH
jgi:hypothetical protein